ncbi:folate-biopterin transporter [Tribonema minus]|uniref:Folate-biopterin transporter n=1 Tax=Tribonema minus TaxID=303371 RepID=A0A836CBB7_9STRA|nr:folate-biopterin transporter [Tribonema minus]
MLSLGSPPRTEASQVFFPYSPISDLPHHAKQFASAAGLKLTDASNIAIPISYWLIGFLGSFIGTPLTVFLVQSLNAQPAQQNTIGVLLSIPWSFKLLYGFVSDVLPVGGLRRKPYFALGFALHSACFLLLAALEKPTFSSLAVLLFVATIGQIMADVMADTLVVERARLEDTEQRGQLQATCYAVRFMGSVLGCLMGAVVYNQVQWGWGLSFRQVCLLTGALPLMLLGTTLWTLYEMAATPKTVAQQCGDIWDTICLKAVWKPMAFVYVFNFFQVPNIAWQSFLQLSLHFEPYMLGLMATAGAVMTLLGIIAYKKFFFHVSWRHIYFTSVCVTTAFKLLQMCLIFKWNEKYLHMSNLYFALGDDVITQYIQGVQFLPVCIMYLRLCPDGSEGATYAMLTTFGNIALVCSASVGTLLSKIWEVGNEALRSDDFNGLWRLTLLTSSLAPIPLLLLRLLPANQDEQEHLITEKTRSRLGGSVFLLVLTTSLVWSISESFAVVLNAEAGSS